MLGESLEDRLVLAAVSWINPAGGAWDVGANWSGGSVPTSADDVTIDATSAATISIQSSDNISVNSLTTGANATLSFSGGSLTVAGDSTLSGPLVMSGGALTASGDTAKLTADGATSLSGASLYALSGGTLSFPQLTSYTSNQSTLQASGAGSVLDLSALSTVTYGGNLGVYATSGGEIDLSNLKSLAGSSNPDNLRLSDTGNSTILDGNLSRLDFVYLSLDGTDRQLTDSWVQFTNGFFNVTGGAYTLPGLTDVDGTGLIIRNGGRLALPGLTNFVAGPRDSFVEDPGSLLDMSALTSESGGWPLIVHQGAEVKLTGLTAMTDIYLTDTGGSTVLDNNVKSVSHSNITLDGSDTQVAESWTSFTDSGISVTGGSCDLSRLTTFENSGASASKGGKLVLPGVTDLLTGHSNFSSDGAGSTLDVSALTNVAQTSGASFTATNGGRLLLSGLTDLTTSNFFGIQITDSGGGQVVDDNLTSLSGAIVKSDGTDAHLADAWTQFVNGQFTVTGGSTTLNSLTNADGSYLQALGGGSLALPVLKTYDTSSTFHESNFEADGSGSVLSLPALTSITEQRGYGWNVDVASGGQILLPALTNLAGTADRHLSVRFSGSGTIVDANLTNLSYVDVTFDGAGTQAGNAWTDFLHGTIDVNGGNEVLPALTNLDGASIYMWNGGKLALSALTALASDSSFAFDANGAGSELDLSALTSYTPGSSWNLSAWNGGEIKLTNLASFDGGFGVSLVDSGHSTIYAPNLTSLTRVYVWTDGTDPQLGSAWTSFTNGGLNLGEGNSNDPTAVKAGTLTLPNLVDIDGSGFSASAGGALNLPALTQALQNVNFTADGPGSAIKAPALSSITAQYRCGLKATNGGDIELPVLSTLNAYNGYFSIDDTNHSTVLLPASLTKLNGVSVTVDGTDNQLADAWTSFTQGTFAITGGAYDLTQLADIDGSSFTVKNGASLVLPSVVSYTSNAASFEAIGAGSVLDAPALTSVSPSGGWTLHAAAGGAVKAHKLTSLTSTESINITAEGNGSAVELPALTSFTGPNISITVGQDGDVVLGAQTVTMPASGSGATISVPQLPFDVMINLDSIGTFSGGTTFNIGQGDSVNLIGGTYTGGVMFNVPAGVTVDLTGGNLVNYSGTLAASGAGTVQLASGGVVAAPGGLTLDFPTGAFAWTGGEFFPANGQVTNAGSLEIAGGPARKFAGDFINSGALTVDAGGVLSVGGSFTQTPSGALTLQVAGAPASKQYGRLTVQNSATLDGSLGATLTGNFVPQDNEDFQAITFAGSSGDFAAVAGLGPDFRERLQPTSLDLLTSSHDTIDSPVGFTLHTTEGAAANGVVASFSDANPAAQAGDFTATIDWGDGATTSGGIAAASSGGFEVSGSHAYAEEGTHPISVQINNLGGASATVASKAVIAETSVTGDGATLTATQNAPLADAVVVTFTHGDGSEQAAGFSAAIDWGDGQSSVGTVTESNGTYAVAGSHTYAQSGNFVIKTTISDDGAQTVLSGSATVASVGTPHEQYVTAVYEDVLGRAPDTGGLAYWSKRLDLGAAISSVAESIAHSDEYYANFVIKPDYLKLLGRAADDTAVTHWTALMHGGLTDQQLEADLVSSHEFFANAGGTNTHWIDSVYKLLLGRPASSADESYWNDQLSAGQTLSKVARRIAESQENNTQLINDDYFHYLGRTADAGGLAYWLKQFAAGKTNEDVIAGFTGSSEYYKEHTS